MHTLDNNEVTAYLTVTYLTGCNTTTRIYLLCESFLIGSIFENMPLKIDYALFLKMLS
jgi:hypothetical protein